MYDRLKVVVIVAKQVCDITAELLIEYGPGLLGMCVVCVRMWLLTLMLQGCVNWLVAYHLWLWAGVVFRHC